MAGRVTFGSESADDVQVGTYNSIHDKGGSCSRGGAAGVSTMLSESGVRDVFFSPSNVDALQEGVRYGVYMASGGKHVIGRQSDNELMVVMRSTFLQESKNLEVNVLEQIKVLNAVVLQYCVPLIHSNVIQFYGYKKDISKLPVPLEHGANMSSSGSKVLYVPSF
jgi:hypothetical protein